MPPTGTSGGQSLGALSVRIVAMSTTSQNDNMWQAQVAEKLRAWALDDETNPAEIRFRMIRNLGGSGWTTIYRLDTNLGQFVAKFSNATSETESSLSTLLVEGQALQALGQQRWIRVPQVICLPDSACNLLLIEFIPQRKGEAGFDYQFGTCLAQMHQALVGERYGWHTDNYLGATLQRNNQSNNWAKFWMENRFHAQTDLLTREFEDIRIACQELTAPLQRFLDSYPAHPPSLIHGDLWSGNFWADETGTPVMIDPACYYADPVAELGMLSLFGGVSDAFFRGYWEIMPKPAGSDTAIAVYRFYHLINHLNLFGLPYLKQVELELANLKKRLS